MPSVVNFTRLIDFVVVGIVCFTASDVTSMMAMPPFGARLAAHSSLPKMSIPSGPFTAGICLRRTARGAAPRSMAVTESEPMFAVYTFF